MLTNEDACDIIVKLSARNTLASSKTILENDTENEQEAKQSIREKLSETLDWLRVLAHLRLIEIVD